MTEKIIKGLILPGPDRYGWLRNDFKVDGLGAGVYEAVAAQLVAMGYRVCYFHSFLYLGWDVAPDVTRFWIGIAPGNLPHPNDAAEQTFHAMGYAAQ